LTPSTQALFDRSLNELQIPKTHPVEEVILVVQNENPTSSQVKCKTLHVRDERSLLQHESNIPSPCRDPRLLEPDSSMPAETEIVRHDPVLESRARSMNYRTTARVVPAWKSSFEIPG
jgi:hypothetical protein